MSRRPRPRRVLAALLVAAGLLLLADAAVTLVWQEPVSALRAQRAQAGLEEELRRLEAGEPAAGDRVAAGSDRERDVAAHRGAPAERRQTTAAQRRRVAGAARRLDRRVPAGAAIGRLRIPAIGLRTVLVHGSAPADLRRGPGTIDGAPLPGARGTAAVAGHRTTYGGPLRDVDRLAPGDVVVAEMPYATLRYRVEGRRIVQPAEVAVLRRTGHDRLALVACHPRFSAARRIVVLARLVSTRLPATAS